MGNIYTNKMYDPEQHNLTNAKPDDFVAFMSPNESFTLTLYILKTSLDKIKRHSVPQENNVWQGNEPFFINDSGKYVGHGCTSFFLKSKEIQKYMMEDSEFIARAIRGNVTWFLPEEAQDIFVF